jgi:hypothetical protein
MFVGVVHQFYDMTIQGGADPKYLQIAIYFWDFGILFLCVCVIGFMLHAPFRKEYDMAYK